MKKVSTHYQDPNASLILIEYLIPIIMEYKNREKIILCIGTDRSTGDSLGPLVGTFLKDNLRDFNVMGTLHKPIHAVNIEENLNTLDKLYKKPLTIAVDACIGQDDNIGYISFYKGGLSPGAGVGKSLPKVGDYSITGVVNSGGFYDFQSTRLSLVYDMASLISNVFLTVNELLIGCQ